MTARAGSALGIRPGIPVVAGIVDAFASYHGAGMARAGDAMDPGGSAGGFGVYWDRPARGPRVVLDDRPAARPVLGRAARWPRRAGPWTGSGSTSSAAACTTETLIAEAGSVPAGADGVVFLPYLAGERSPLWDPAARGAFAGLALGHRPGAPDAGDPRGLGVRDPPRRRGDPRGRRRGPGDARLRRAGPERDLEPDQGRRDRVHGRGARRARDRRRGLGDPRRDRRRRLAGPAGARSAG